MAMNLDNLVIEEQEALSGYGASLEHTDIIISNYPEHPAIKIKLLYCTRTKGLDTNLIEINDYNDLIK